MGLVCRSNTSSRWLVAASVGLLPLTLAHAAPEAAPPPAGSAAPPARTFFLQEYQVEGNTLLPTIEVERAVMAYLGENRSIKDIDEARAQLERVYHDRGFRTVLVNIPEQQIAEGVVRLHVTEAPVGKLHIEGSRYHSLEAIGDKLTQLRQGTVPDFGEVQKQLGQVNRSADLRVTPVLKASETPGRVDVDLRVSDKLPLHAIAEVNNRYSSSTSELRAIGELRYDNLFQRDQSLSLQYQMAPSRPDDAQVWSLSYVIPMRSNLVWALYAVRSDSNIAAVGDLNVIGKGNIFGARLIAPLPSEDRSFYHSFTAGLDYKDFKQSVVLQGSDGSVESPASYPAFTAQYSATWLGEADEHSAGAATSGARSGTTLDASIGFIVRGLGTHREQFADKRAGAGPSYFTFHPGLERQQVLSGSWSLVGRIDGQLASGPLINNEEFAAGGADSVRGYTESERLADEGVRVSLELRTPQLLRTLFTGSEQSYVLLFAEGARLRVLDPLPEQESLYNLASIGLGLRFKAAGLFMGLDGARVLKAGGVTPEGSYRGLFRLSYAY